MAAGLAARVAMLMMCFPADRALAASDLEPPRQDRQPQTQRQSLQPIPVEPGSVKQESVEQALAGVAVESPPGGISHAVPLAAHPSANPSLNAAALPFNTPWDAPHLLNASWSWGGEHVSLIGTRPASAGQAGEQWLGQELKLAVAAKPFARVSGLVSLKWQKLYVVDRPDHASQLGFESAYLSWLDAGGEPRLSLGRYYYEDSRGFLFHQSVDGLHAEHRWSSAHGDWQARAFAGRQGVWKENLLAQGDDDTSYGFVELQLRHDARQASAYVLARESHTADNDSPVLLGVRSSGRLSSSWDHWLELMLARGESGSQSLRGYGIDVGGVWRWSPAISAIAGYAYASGHDRDSDDGVNRRFRQTGLQLNNGWIGEGGTKLKYYGELTKPELSNIGLSTLGLRFTPAEGVSLEVLYHRYRQAQADTRFYGYGLKDAPNGLDRALGEELDLVFSYRRIRGLKLELNLAQFWPGEAFGAQARPLSLIYLETRWRF